MSPASPGPVRDGRYRELEEPRHSAAVSLGAELESLDGWGLVAGYAGRFGKGAQDHGFRLGGSLRYSSLVQRAEPAFGEARPVVGHEGLGLLDSTELVGDRGQRSGVGGPHQQRERVCVPAFRHRRSKGAC